MDTTRPAPRHTITLDTGPFVTDGTTSILEAALAQGIPVPFSCQRGACGSCRAEVVEGCFERIAPPTDGSYQTAADELLMCQCRAASDLTLRFPHWRAPAQARPPRRANVVSRLPLAPDVTQLIVELQDGEDYDYLPGQHAQLILEGGARRNFSIANAPAAAGPARLEFHIRHMPGGAFTSGILPALQSGDPLTLDAARGDCTWRVDELQDIDHLVLLATGTGYAGVAPIIMAALHSRALETVTLYWGGRTPDDHYASQMLDALQGKGDGFQWHAVLSAGESARKHVQEAAAEAGHDWSRSLVYACGNPAMVSAARERLLAAGLPAYRYRAEAFHPAASGPAGAAPQRPAHPWERISPRYTLAGILDARRRSMRAVEEIAGLIRPGMTTREAIAIADEHLRRMGASHNWHPTYVRFGPDTQSPPIQRTDYDRKLLEQDLFVLDIGPVWDGYEGDYGDTFVLGADEDRRRCAEAARSVFKRTRQAWLEGLTGTALYDRATEYAREHGCELVREIPGHRVSDFPHALYGRHLLAQADFVPADGIWVLEIQVRDARRPLGAFYEDVLLR
ncbi:NAD(P)H dependent flavin oxidoreductase family protein [Achromobacter insolitus]|uniref:NAD(P)H dependent flavin oxidoreductase family protein n=1 Tax=Achromobacter insolitus TaxID=217204 RepID=UPI0011EB981D|nr:NAD(P)H dependent flavin oxidoreductase family protein [Achromobacter insolitus]QEK92649.1 NAD(P)H dependent flavin oxidoreductase family protein [Achromobacter insolitus]